MLLQDESEALAKEGVKINLIKSGKYKAEGHPSQPLSDETRSFLQSQCDTVYSMFVKAVAQNRKTSQATVREGYGQGRSLLAADAVKAGLADRVGTLDDVLAKHGVSTGASASGEHAPITHATDVTNITDATGTMLGGAQAESRLEKLRARTGAAKPGEDDDQDEDEIGCRCKCANCQGCKGGVTAGARADDDMSCRCDCDACQACSYKGGAKGATVIPAVIPEPVSAEAAQNFANLARKMASRRRELDL